MKRKYYTNLSEGARSSKSNKDECVWIELFGVLGYHFF
jgi:hypothetical protein